ncbi:glucosaminidase domain-containing protein [Paraburkholderia caffeinilytica]|uniref:glucosaminidase domain-containing protein n=1 Tax=Paraburkholderia caffeinilytica TaxID=1761016 RepID=UPI003DA09D36
MPAPVQSFISQYAPLAAQVGQQIGVAPEVVLGHWGEETGWGKSVIPGTNNLGNMKGPGVTATDNMTGSTDQYQAFGTPDAFGSGFANLIANRYPGAMGSGDNAQAYATALQKGGYAQDPNYATKLTGAVATVRKFGDLLASTISGTARADELTPAQRGQQPAGNDPFSAAFMGTQPARTPPVAAQAPAPSQQGASGPSNDAFSAAFSAPVPANPTGKVAGVASAPQPPAGQPVAATPVTAAQRLGQGLIDPMNAGAQLLTHALPGGLVDAVNRGTQWVNDQPVIGPITKALGMVPASAPQVDSSIANQEQRYQAARTAAGQSGTDWLRLGGNIVSPVTIGAAMIAPAAGAGIGGLAAAGVGSGALGGALQPVTQDADTRFGGQKLGQMLLGAGTGGIATPVMSKVVLPIASKVAAPIMSTIGSYLSKTFGGAADAQVAGQAASPVDQAIEQGAQATGRTAADIPADQLASLRGTVSNALQNGQQVDPAALLRKADFDDIEMPYTLGQITRDPAQFAAERNLRGVAGVGESLLNRFNTQNQLLQSRVASLGANQALEPYQAGQMLTGSLANVDNGMRQAVTDAYAAARASTGKNLDVPLTGLAQDYAQVLNDFGDKVPSGVRNNFNQLGLMGATQQKVFSIENAENLLKVINANQSNDPATNAALGTLRNSVKSAILSADDQGGVFAAPRALAAQHFALQDAVPALQAASNSSVAPDNFVQRFIINGNTDEVKGLANLLDPESFQQARAQIGSKLQDAAFGQNAAGDKIFSPERYAKALNDLGTDKLGAFFSPPEIAQMHTLGRVGAYINSTPSAAAVNTSNTSGAILSAVGNGALGLLHVLPGGGLAAGAISKGVQGVANARAVGEAMSAKVPQTMPPGNPAQAALLGRLLTGGGLAAGVAAAPR